MPLADILVRSTVSRLGRTMTDDAEGAGNDAQVARDDDPGEVGTGQGDPAGFDMKEDVSTSDDQMGSDCDELAEDSSVFQQHSRNINNFFAGIQAENSVFGVATSVRRVTGTISVAELSSALDHIVLPTAFDDVVERLSKNRLLILFGPEGIGKRTGALAALHAAADPGQPVTSLPPSRTLSELAEYQHFKAGRGYLVQDWIVPSASGSPLGFDIDVLKRQLRRQGTYLVITAGTQAGRNRFLAEVAVAWQPPDLVAVFEQRLPTTGVALSEADMRRITDRLVGLCQPSDVVAVLRRLPEGVDAALDVLGDTDRERVRTWFDRKPDPRELLSLAALSFLNEVPESIFQSRLARLVELAGVRHLGTASESEPGGFSTPFPQHEPLADGGLDEVAAEQEADNRLMGDRRRRFRSARYHQLVMAELCGRYGFELWQPVRLWLNELATEPPSVIQVSLALGMALYAQHAPSDVESAFLDVWSNGLMSERLSAAYLLSWMCIDDALAATALRIAVRWTRNAGTRRAATAAMAFGSELGIRYQPEALSWLWYLVLRNEAVSRTARTSLGDLFRASVDDPASATTVLRYLNGALRQLLHQGAGRPEHGSFTDHLRKATSAVFAVLSTRPHGSAESMTAIVLRTLPANAPVLGQLWAEVLRSWRHRNNAIDELRAVLDTMLGDEESLRAVRTFGAAVRAHLSDEESRLLRRDLGHVLSRPDSTAPRALISALLTTLEHGSARLSAASGDRNH